VKKKAEFRRVLGRQVAVELPEDELVRARGEEEVWPEGTRTCDGTVTHTAGGRDCEGGAGPDDDAYTV
jgi:hypothetical protein